MVKMAPVGRTLTESPDPLAIRKRPRSSRCGVVRISIDESNVNPPAARDLSYIGLLAESGKACQPKPDFSANLILAGRNLHVEKPAQSPCSIRWTKTRVDERGRKLRY